jgi:8-oxo-dGTP pyrophosphatase MutT (NUDIX family)
MPADPSPPAANAPPRRILDPHSVPVVGTDAHLPAVAFELLSAERLRARFAATHEGNAWVPELPGDGGRFVADRAPTPAAVLVPLVQRASGLHVLLTRRTEHLRDHAGQISFPGGRSEPDDGGPNGTALRETEEEVGLARQHIELIGRLPEYQTVTSYVVTPVVALVQPPFELRLDGFEVAEAFEVPLVHLMTPANHRRHRFEFDGRTRQFLSMPWRGVDAAGAEREYFIWGATAAMLRNLYRYLAE